MQEILTRMGDGQKITMSPSHVKEDLATGTQDAADRGRIPPLSQSELDHLFEIVADRNRAVAVEPGQEIVLTDDMSCVRHIGDEGAAGGVGIPMSRMQAILIHERAYAQDSAVLQVPYGTGGNIQRVKEKIDIDM